MARCARNDCRRWRPDSVVRYARLGLRVDGAWFCSPECVESATRRRLSGGRQAASTPAPMVPPLPALRLGILLLHQGAIRSSQLAQALGAQRESGLPLGAQLLRMGFTDADSILRGLAAQAGVSYLTAIDPSCVDSAPGGLSADEVRALGVVPLRVVQSSRLLMVACAAPLPRAALSVLRQLTGWTPEPYLVSDADWQTLIHAYAKAAGATVRRAAFTRVHDLHDAAARVAATAAAERNVTVTEARDDRSTWVRVESTGAVSTLLLSEAEGDTCRAATTSH